MYKLFCAVAFFLVVSLSAASAEENVNIYAKPRRLPDYSLTHQSGKNFKLADFSGEFVVAVFWSRDCVPCIRELRSLNGFHKETQGTGVKLVLISPDDEWNSTVQQKKFLRRYGAPDVDFYVDKGGRLAAALGIFTSPHTVLVNKKGEEIGRIRGSAKWDRDDVIEYIYQLKAKHG